MYQKLGYKGIVPALLCVGGVGFVAYEQSEKFQIRINQVITEVKEYKTTQNRNSGVNLRLEFYENSLELAKVNPGIRFRHWQFWIEVSTVDAGKKDNFLQRIPTTNM